MAYQFPVDEDENMTTPKHEPDPDRQPGVSVLKKSSSESNVSEVFFCLLGVVFFLVALGNFEV